MCVWYRSGNDTLKQEFEAVVQSAQSSIKAERTRAQTAEVRIHFNIQYSHNGPLTLYSIKTTIALNFSIPGVGYRVHML